MAQELTSYVKNIEVDESSLRAALKHNDTHGAEAALTKLRDDSIIPDDISNWQNNAKKVFDQVSADDKKLGLPSLLFYDNDERGIKVDPKIAAPLDKAARNDEENKVLADAAKGWSANNERHLPVDKAITADAQALASGQTDQVGKDLMAIWKAAGTPGVFAFADQLNNALQKSHPNMKFDVGGVSTGMVSDVNAQSPLCAPRVSKDGQVIETFKVY